MLDTSGCRKQLVVDQEICLLDIHDTAGQEEHSIFRIQSLNEGDGFLFVFDINNAKSLNKFSEWSELIKRAKEMEQASPESWDLSVMDATFMLMP